MDLPGDLPEHHPLVRWGTRANVVINSTRREFAYRWTTPRPPVLRIALLPVVLAAGLFLLLLGVVLVALALALAAGAVLGFGLVRLFSSIGVPLGVRRH
jgi:hypothetical protein